MYDLTISVDTPEFAAAIIEVLDELNRAQKKHPNWPVNVIDQAAIVAEESGELIREALHLGMEGRGSFQDYKTEAIQTACTALRLLKNLPKTRSNYALANGPFRINQIS